MAYNSPVSICLVTFNRATLLPKTLDSLLAQTFSDYELIISDDCSTDDTERVCQEYARLDKRIRYIRQARNLGMPGNLNAVLRAGRGKYLANLHDGDVYRADLIEKWYTALESYPTAGFVFNSYRSTRKGREVIYREPYPPLIPGRVLGLRLLSRWDSCVFGTVMARRDVYERLGWFDPRFGNFSDVDMWLRIAREYDVAYVDEPLIDLMPKDPTRFYGFVHWQVIFWILGIHTLNLQRYRPLLPAQVDELARRYPQRRRYYLIYNMLLCVKHKRFDRVREGLAIWRDADDLWLKLFGRTLGNPKDAPEWYDAEYYWKTVRLLE
jgi:glycosyltransferase involved in cell wall biosynthesis